MTIEDLTDYDEFGGSIIYIPLSITTMPIVDHTAAQRGGMTEPLESNIDLLTLPLFWDSMARKVECGDILMWKSGGFFNCYLSYGIVLSIFREGDSKVIVLNTKKNKVTIWSTFDKTILAKHDNYDIIPDRFKDIWGI